MRESKFRGKDIYTDEWIVGYLTKTARAYITDFDGNTHTVFPHTIGEFTGIRNLNKQDIFEDDIVKTKSGKIQTIIWVPNKCAFICFTVGSNRPKLLDVSDEVVGNTHDNPELLQ